MKQEKNILIKFGVYVGLFIVIIIIGITKCFALTNNQSISFYDNNGSSLTAVTTDYYAATDESSATFTTTANSYGGAVMIQAGTPLIQNHLYTLFINVGAANMGGMTELSSKNCVGLGSTYATAINSYVNCNITPRYSQKSGVTTDKGRGLYFTFVANTNGAYILIPYTSHETCYNCYQYSHGFNLEDGGDTTGLTQQQVNNLISNQTTIIQNEISNMQQDISGSIDNMKDSINDNIDNNLNTCIEAKDVYPEFASIRLTTTNGGSVEPSRYHDSGAYLDVSKYHNKTIRIIFSNLDSSLSPRTNYCFTTNLVGTGTKCVASVVRTNAYTSNFYEVEVPENANHLYLLGYLANEDTSWVNKVAIQLPKVCTNKLDEANETNKGILGKIRELIEYINPLSEKFFVYKLIELLGDLLEDLFVPDSTFIKNWYDDFKGWFELKLGFLATPFTIFIDFIETFLNLEESNLVINIPRIVVPNFEENVLIEARTFNWGELLNSKQEFRTLWELYLDFIDVFLILNFLGLCETKYNRIFGGDTTPYEYYTTEETYNINDETGEATNHMLRQRTTRRERVK